MLNPRFWVVITRLAWQNFIPQFLGFKFILLFDEYIFSEWKSDLFIFDTRTR